MRQARGGAVGTRRGRSQGDAAEPGAEGTGAGDAGREAYKLLGLHSFFTAGPTGNSAWTIPIGETWPQAAGVIHTDFERGFIRAEIYGLAELQQYKTEAAIKQAGKMRVEGKAYVMKDGDITHFLFNV